MVEQECGSFSIPSAMFLIRELRLNQSKLETMELLLCHCVGILYL